jgi:hypothetical protein
LRGIDDRKPIPDTFCINRKAKNIAMVKDQNDGLALIKFMSRHLVALVGDTEPYDRKAEQWIRRVSAISGFILSLNERWYWLTAGHCLQRLDEGLGDGTVRISNGHFMDYFGTGASYRVGLPFTYERGDGCYLHRPELGLDFGFIKISDLIRQGFEKNGVVAISRANWLEQASRAFVLYRMLSLPSNSIDESTEISANDQKSAGIQPVMLAIDSVDPTKLPGPPADTWFAGRIDPAADIEDIAGMSGGPIFGFSKMDNGGWGYKIVAVQSRWRRDSRIVFGCSVPLFAEAIHKTLASLE